MRISDWRSDVCSSDLLGRDVAELCVRIVRYHADQPGQVVAQPAETLPALECRLVHVERTVDLDLKAMALPGGIGIGADDLDALVGIVHAHAIAEPFQRLAHEGDELGGAGGDRKSVVEGKSVAVRVDLGGGRIIKK